MNLTRSQLVCVGQTTLHSLPKRGYARERRLSALSVPAGAWIQIF